MTHTSRKNLTLCLGYLDGLRTRRHITKARAERMLEGLTAPDVDAYLAGHADGVRGDRSRYMVAHAALANTGVTVQR